MFVPKKLYYTVAVLLVVMFAFIYVNIDKNRYDQIDINVEWVNWYTINLNDNLTGDVVFNVKWAEKATIQWSWQEIIDWKVKYFADLTTERTQKIDVWWENKYNKWSATFTITRNATEEEIKIEEEEKRVVAEAEAKRAAEEKAKEEEKARVEKELQAKYDRETAQLQTKYEKIAKNGYLYEIEQKLHSLWFKQIDSWFAKAPDWSTQVQTIYQWEDNGYDITITLQNSYSLWNHYYTVSVK